MTESDEFDSDFPLADLDAAWDRLAEETVRINQAITAVLHRAERLAGAEGVEPWDGLGAIERATGWSAAWDLISENVRYKETGEF